MSAAGAGVLVGLRIGRVRPLPPDGRPSAIAKDLNAAPLWLAAAGLEGDQQADRRHHGGADKAVLQVPEEHYARLAELLRGTGVAIVAGLLGENFGSRGMLASEVCIGDRFRLGGALIEISQPRQPCFKLNLRLQHAAAAEMVAEHALGGWYWRVIEAGEVALGDRFDLVSRAAPAVSVARVWALHQAHRPDPGELAAVAGLAALNAQWASRFRQRAQWLRDNHKEQQ